MSRVNGPAQQIQHAQAQLWLKMQHHLVLLFLSLTLLLIICKLNSKTGMEKYFKRKSEFESSSFSKGISKI